MTTGRDGRRSEVAREAGLNARLFLERRGYQQRRLVDAVRLLPFVGLFLWLLPLVWSSSEGVDVATGVHTSSAIFYLFAVWAGLIIVGAVLTPRIRGLTDLPQDSASEPGQEDVPWDS